MCTCNELACVSSVPRHSGEMCVSGVTRGRFAFRKTLFSIALSSLCSLNSTMSRMKKCRRIRDADGFSVGISASTKMGNQFVISSSFDATVASSRLLRHCRGRVACGGLTLGRGLHLRSSSEIQNRPGVGSSVWIYGRVFHFSSTGRA